jgi:hypothetical protein
VTGIPPDAVPAFLPPRQSMLTDPQATPAREAAGDAQRAHERQAPAERVRYPDFRHITGPARHSFR